MSLLDPADRDRPTAVGVPCPWCGSTVAEVVGIDLSTGRCDLACLMCRCPHVLDP